MDGYKYEMHLHTSEVSSCARVSARDIPKLYQSKGYDVLVVTDHYRKGFFESRKYRSWDDAVSDFTRGYYKVANEGVKCGIRVLLGMEITFNRGLEDYLIYGINEEFLRKHPKLYKKNIKHIYKLAEKNNLFVAQAHPFREYIKHVETKYIHGFEVYNGSKTHNSHNDEALSYAEEHNLIQIGGSDFHHDVDLGRGATIFNNLADTSEELAELLHKKDVIKVIGGNQ